MIQHILIFIIFLAAAAYMARMLYSTFSSKASGCPKGCGSCSAVDIKKIESEIKRRQEMMNAGKASA